MEQRYLIPLGNHFSTASGAVEKNIYYCVDFVITYSLQSATFLPPEELQTLFHVYLDMLIENDMTESENMELEDLKVQEFYDFVGVLYRVIFAHLAPTIARTDWHVYTIDHFQIVNNNLYIQLDLDADEEEPILALPVLTYSPSHV